MAQDIRELLKNTTDIKQHSMPEGHEKRFEARLNRMLPKRQKRASGWIGIAASVAVVVGIGYLSYRGFAPQEHTPQVVKGSEGNVTQPQENIKQQITLGDISPDLKKVEDYYVTHINIALSKLAVDKENKQLFDSYMTRLTELNDEYQTLNKELNDIGPNEQSVNALIGNLQLRLQLLYKLKEKLNELKNVKNENSIEQQI